MPALAEGTTTAGPGNTPTTANDVASLPVLGMPLVSGSFIGTIEIERFRARGNKIVADTVLRKTGQKATPAQLPVAIAYASCQVLELRVGPPKGAVHPLVITEYPGSGARSTTEFCDIASANGVQALVAALNGTSAPQGTRGCSVADVYNCKGPVAACSATCTAPDADWPTCYKCYNNIRAWDCYYCGPHPKGALSQLRSLTVSLRAVPETIRLGVPFDHTEQRPCRPQAGFSFAGSAK